MKLRQNIDFTANRFLMFVMDDLANKREFEEHKEAIRLTLGKSELPLNEEITDAMCNTLRSRQNSSLVYPAGLPQLKDALSRYYDKNYNVHIPSKNFIISPGTSCAFRNLFSLLSGPGDEVLIPIPYYSLYHFCALLSGANVRYYRIDPHSRRLDMESFKENFSEKTKIVVINTPGNPLGNIINEKELRQMDGFIDGRAVVINDEIYANAYFDEKPRSVVQLGRTKSIFITTNAFSKAYRMYARRVGYSVVPDELIEPLTVIQHHTLLTVDPAVQFGAIAALERQSDVDELVALYRERRDYTMLNLDGIDGVRPIYSEGGFYITIDCDELMRNKGYGTSLALAEKIFADTSVAVVPGSDFGLERTLRLSFSSSKYNEGIDRLAGFFKS